jgi:hypothetical protein
MGKLAVHLTIDRVRRFMTDTDLLRRYNYDAFIPENFEPWLNFAASPPLGQPAPDFLLWRLDDRHQTSLKEIWTSHTYTVVEFGSFT